MNNYCIFFFWYTFAPFTLLFTIKNFYDAATLVEKLGKQAHPSFTLSLSLSLSPALSVCPPRRARRSVCPSVVIRLSSLLKRKVTAGTNANGGRK